MMTGLDTNILVRFFAKDDLEQSGRARELLRTFTPQSPGFISMVSLIELFWVLRSQYRQSKAELIECLERVLDTPELIAENHSAATQALHRFASGKADFADCLIERLGHAAGCKETVTFDVSASRSAGMRQL
jgi:predicted nucleic-acid-binding protein